MCRKYSAKYFFLAVLSRPFIPITVHFPAGTYDYIRHSAAYRCCPKRYEIVIVLACRAFFEIASAGSFGSGAMLKIKLVF